MTTPIDISEKKGVRYLHFGSEWVQGAMRINNPKALQLGYTRDMMAGLLLRDAEQSCRGPWPRNALLIGLGAASLTKFLYYQCPQTRIEIVEIEPRVVMAARQFFALPPEDERLTIHIDDGVHYTATSNRHFDYILVDGFDQNARAGGLDTLPFYQAAWARLSEQGIMSVNLLGRSRGYKKSLEHILTTFHDRALAFSSSDSGNVIALAARGEIIDLPVHDIRERAVKLKQTTGLDLLATVTRLEEAGHFPGERLIL